MQLVNTTKAVFAELVEALHALSREEYTIQCRHLSQATIGQHVRHVVELYQCLIDGYETGTVNYELRKRDRLIETDKDFAVSLLSDIANAIQRTDKPLVMQCALGGDEIISTPSNFRRELVYNLEHTIHHMALIRVGVEEMSEVILQESFGVAPSTIQYRKACAQ